MNFVWQLLLQLIKCAVVLNKIYFCFNTKKKYSETKYEYNTPLDFKQF